MSDLRVALRQYRRQPGFALTATFTLALAIGATTAVFAVVNSVLVQALPFGSPDRLVWVASVRPDNPGAPFTLPEFIDYRSRARTLVGLAAYGNWSANLAGNDGITERLQGARMSANAFDVLGVAPAAGRLLNEADDRPEAPAVVVLSYRLWQRQYGGSADVVGKAVRINGESFTVAGVLPPQFPLPLRDIDVVIPLVPDRDPLRHLRNSVNFLRLFGRLHPGTSAGDATVELTAICRSLREQFPVEYARKEAVRAIALHEVVVGEHRQSMLILFAAVIVVLVTALANLASLAMVRANARAGELSMRIAIGASRRHLVRQLTLEALLLALAAGWLGWLVAGQAIAAVKHWGPSVPRLDEVRLDSSAALFVGVVTLVVTVLAAAAPLTAMAGMLGGHALRPASRGAIGDRSNHRARNAIVVAEICAALVLVVSAGVLFENLRWLQSLDPGFEADGVFQARLSIPSSYRIPADVERFYDRLHERIAAAPGVKQAGVISVAPLSGLLSTVPFAVAGRPFEARDKASANLRIISPGYLPAVGTRLLQGRPFLESDGSNGPPVAIVSAALADRFLAGAAPGQKLMVDDNNSGPRPIEIVGVVENVRHAALDLPPAFDIYVPLRQVHPDNVASVRNNQFWMVRTGADPAAFRETFLMHVRAVDADGAVSRAGPMRQFVDAWLGPRRFTFGLLGAFALTAVLLAVSGLYGLVSYAVSQRTAEIGLRLAVGASPGDVERMILRQAAGLGLQGAAAGACLVLTVRPLIPGLPQAATIGPAMIVAAVSLLMAVALIAAWLPARRAARIDPILALKRE